MAENFTFEQVMVLLSATAGCVIFVGFMGWGIVTWAQGRLDTERVKTSEDAAKSAVEHDAAVEDIREALKQWAESFKQELKTDREITQKGFELLHSRQSNARKDFVDLRQYDKDLSRLDAGTSKILDAIEKLASSVRHDLRSTQQTVIAVQSIQQQITDRLQGLEQRQGAMIGLLKPAAAE